MVVSRADLGSLDQGRGVGRGVMTHVLGRAWAAGRIRIELCVRADHRRARALYASLGFECEAGRATSSGSTTVPS